MLHCPPYPKGQGDSDEWEASPPMHIANQELVGCQLACIRWLQIHGCLRLQDDICCCMHTLIVERDGER